MQADGIDTMVIVPLYPQFSISTSGSSLRLLQELFYSNKDDTSSTKSTAVSNGNNLAKNEAKQLSIGSWFQQNEVVHTVVSSWYQRPGYVKTMARLIKEQLLTFSAQELQEGNNQVTMIVCIALYSYICDGLIVIYPQLISHFT